MTITHEERRQVRRAMIAEVNGGMSKADAAKKYGFTKTYVRLLCSEVPSDARRRSGRRAVLLRELHSLQIPQRRCAELLGVALPTISILARRLGLKFSKAWHNRHPGKAINDSRVEIMAALYRAGYTLAQIGTQYGISRERVRQLLKHRKGMDRSDGGLHAQSEARADRVLARKNAKYLERCGCTWDQYAEIRAMGRDLKLAGVPHSRTPLGAFTQQRFNAGRRGIGWELKFWDWWTIWQQSGHWDQRGRGQGYVMCRTGDIGPYAIGNVFIALAVENSAEAQSKKRVNAELPRGVRRAASGRYVAQRSIHGKVHRLGTHDTPELAYAAYLMAGTPDARAA